MDHQFKHMDFSSLSLLAAPDHPSKTNQLQKQINQPIKMILQTLFVATAVYTSWITAEELVPSV